MESYFIDTNIFLRIFTADIEKQKVECLKFLTNAESKGINIYTSSLVLAEITWTLNSFYKFPKQNVSTALRSIINLKGIKIVDNYQPLVAIDFFENFSIKFIDSLLASIPQILERKWIILSYDKEFDRLPVKREEPS